MAVSSKFSAIQQSPFRVERGVGPLVYELELPPKFRIHSVLYVVHFEQAQAPDSFNYPRPSLTNASCVIDAQRGGGARG